MKLVITVTDDRVGTLEETLLEATHAETTRSGSGQSQTFDGGPVPDRLLDMEREVAAGQAPAPGTGL